MLALNCQSISGKIRVVSWLFYCRPPVFFFFHAGDGIRDATVTGVQTCALPIWTGASISICWADADPIVVSATTKSPPSSRHMAIIIPDVIRYSRATNPRLVPRLFGGRRHATRSEERRVGKEGGSAVVRIQRTNA